MDEQKPKPVGYVTPPRTALPPIPLPQDNGERFLALLQEILVQLQEIRANIAAAAIEKGR